MKIKQQKQIKAFLEKEYGKSRAILCSENRIKSSAR